MTDFAEAKSRLEQMLQDLTARADEIDDELSQPGDDDWEDNASESAEDEVLVEVSEMTREEIRRVKDALSRISFGSYGVCSSCGRSIAKPRLQALPYATKCVRCS